MNKTPEFTDMMTDKRIAEELAAGTGFIDIAHHRRRLGNVPIDAVQQLRNPDRINQSPYTDYAVALIGFNTFVR